MLRARSARRRACLLASRLVGGGGVVPPGDDPGCGWCLGWLFVADASQVGEEVLEGFGVTGNYHAVRGAVFGDQVAVVVAVLDIDPVAEGFVQMPEPAFGVEVFTGGVPPALGGVGVVVLGDVVEVAVE